MNRKLVLLLTLVAIAAIFSFPSESQVSGCCCNSEQKSTQEPVGLRPRDECEANFPVFVEPSADDFFNNKTCREICGGVTPPKEVPPTCGEGKVPPGGFVAESVKGEKFVALRWQETCPASAYSIERCDGSGCADFAQIAFLAPTTSYVDQSPELQWKTNYTYRLVAKYNVFGDSEPALASILTGDIECWTALPQFCVAEHYYDQYAQYLQEVGYANIPGTAFKSKFAESLQTAFQTRFDKAFRCTSDNRLTNPLVVCDASAGQFCISAGPSGAECRTSGPCEQGGGPFGLGFTVDTCEKNATAAQFCFLDKSKSIANACFSCQKQMSCYDYRSRGTCERDNCGVGNCKWKDVYPTIGIGTCVDERISNCALCSQKGTEGMPNLEAYNEIYDQCSREKATALSTDNSPCFWNNFQAVGCDGVACSDYSGDTQCNPARTTIKLDQNNRVTSNSSDLCKIGRCQNFGGRLGCRKNSNSDLGEADTGDIPDCVPGDRKCEMDYFPPDTTVVITGSRGRTDVINIILTDKVNKTSPYILATVIEKQKGRSDNPVGKRVEYPAGYTINLCIAPEGQPDCTTFTRINVSLLDVKDLDVKDGNKTLFTLVAGNNKLRYFSVDPAKNREIIKTATIFGCFNCTGPLVNLTLVGGRVVDGVAFTSNRQPRFTAQFDVPSDVTFSLIRRNVTEVQPVKSPASGFNSRYTFQTPTPLADGAYSFLLNARDTRGVFLRDGLAVLKFVVDSAVPTLTITPAAGTVVNATSLNLTVTGNKPIVLTNAMLTTPEIVRNQRREKQMNLTQQFRTRDNRTFTASVGSVLDGRQVLSAQAEDFAGNPASGSSAFLLNGIPEPSIHLKNPPNGVSTSPVFDLTFETDNSAHCSYWSTQTVSPPEDTADWEQFDATDALNHTKQDFQAAAALEGQNYTVVVDCKDMFSGVSNRKSFKLRVDSSSPIIQSAFALPNPVLQFPAKTTLTVSTDDDVFCKYSTTTQDYTQMQGKFPDFDAVYRRTNKADVNLTNNASTTFFIACENEAGLISPTATIAVEFRTDVALTLDSNTSTISPDSNITLTVTTNKIARCGFQYKGSIGFLNGDIVHVARVQTTGNGTQHFEVECTVPRTSPLQTKRIGIDVVVDTTPPFMIYVEGKNEFDNKTYSPFTDKVRVRYLGNDTETRVTRYYYELKTASGGRLVISCTNTQELPAGCSEGSAKLDGDFFYLMQDETGKRIRLDENITYALTVFPQNVVGVLGTPMTSNSMLINISVPDSCRNHIKGENESGVDCGGSTCPKCGDDEACDVNNDCQSNFCSGCTKATKKCGPAVGPQCTDCTKNGNETDIDCGVSPCLDCDDGKACLNNGNCKSNFCDSVTHTCQKRPTCFDGIKNQLETGIDCGGGVCPKCDLRAKCTNNADCISKLCDTASKTCIENPQPNCNNGAKDATNQESDIDCGGLCTTCENGKSCSVACDCKSNFCDAATKKCTAFPPDQCLNGIKDQDEADIDCDGTLCPQCAIGQTCTADDQCVTNLCHPTTHKCASFPFPTCSDTAKNGNETDLNCGGNQCPKCAIPKACAVNNDCSSNNCKDGHCAEPEAATCTDGKRNGGETDVDCGGACPGCEDDQACAKSTDCNSNFCHPTFKKCGRAGPGCFDGAKNNNETDKDCGGDVCWSCPLDNKCVRDTDCDSNFCDQATKTCLRLIRSGCNDQSRNGHESDIDCGGDECPLCGVKKSCAFNPDCQSKFCFLSTGKCIKDYLPPECVDLIKNGVETDIDCGGSLCPKCDLNQTCNANNDCKTTFCDPNTKRCRQQQPPCRDEVKNQDETDIDCGGTQCSGCDNGRHCDQNRDCQSLNCNPNSKTCEAVDRCADNKKDDLETDVDCGGPDCVKCADEKNCQNSNDCINNFCHPRFKKCGRVPEGCADNAKNGAETGVDCGGPTCQKCPLNDGCNADSDCMSNACDPVRKVCINITRTGCDNTVKDRFETDIDCGGTECPKCRVDGNCTVANDCNSNFCDPLKKKCRFDAEPSHCLDNSKDSDETDIDCGGGECKKCPIPFNCNSNTDCVSNNCDPATKKCRPHLPPNCGDGVKNGIETDVDCGGNCPTKCTVDKGCGAASDCASGLMCVNNKCKPLPAYCENGVKELNETDIDCGNTCPACAGNRTCSLNTDCLSFLCKSAKCTFANCTDTVRNQDESDIDCGGSKCGKCAAGLNCTKSNDCLAELTCKNNQCTTINVSCTNNFKDGNETDKDCGGRSCPKCADTFRCIIDDDCTSNICDQATGKCKATTNVTDGNACSNNNKDGSESDIDCGGSCNSCENGKTCLGNSDCKSRNCDNGVCKQQDGCENRKLDVGESDVDCGGRCLPETCGEGESCDGTEDCNTGLECGDNKRCTQPGAVSACPTPCAAGDDDGDCVCNPDDRCPNTKRSRKVDTKGCADEERDTDGDGLPDIWENKYSLNPNSAADAKEDTDKDGLTNLEEFKAGTNPQKADTDEDGWTDKEELDAGTDPLDPESHPTSKLKVALITLLILGVLGAGGYYGYRYYEDQRKQALGKMPPRPLLPLRPLIRPPFRPGMPPRPGMPVAARPGAVVKPAAKPGEMKIGLAPPSPKLAKPSPPDIFERLHKIVIAGMTTTEKRNLLEKLKAAKAGKVPKEELKATADKLRMTPEYLDSHRKNLEDELTAALEEKPKAAPAKKEPVKKPAQKKAAKKPAKKK
ncbi:hypothetical protein HY642_00850 [Candidatus Woesearchaeota archaeon]|nr:hypothetical protein [Candidatus Woesearchaeota archaeon]